jgi:heme-degrading monooxygenase HmoA
MTMSVIELATISIVDGAESKFETAAAQAVPLFRTASGCRSMCLKRSVETGSYVLLVGWDSIEAHVAFRQTDGFAKWRALVGSLFAAPPIVEHLETIVEGF